MKKSTKLISGLLAGMMLLAAPVSAFEGNPDTAAVFSWLGNDFNGQETDGFANQVQQDISNICVTPEGDVFTNIPWEEEGQNITHYNSEGTIVTRGRNSHGWGYHGGHGVAANSKYVFFSQWVENEGGGLYNGWPDKYPPTGYDWWGIQRRLRSDIRVGENFEGGIGKHGAPASQSANFVPTFVVEGGSGAVGNGVAANEEKVYASSEKLNQIVVYDANSMQELARWEVEQPGNLELDDEGNLWVVQRELKKVISLDDKGKIRKQEIQLAENVKPTDICFDNEGNLLVADTGVDEWILVYKDIKTTPTLSHTIGEQGGIFSGVPGEVGDMKFNQISGIGVDAEGNLYVANSGTLMYSGTENGNNYLESYDKDGNKRWDAKALCFVDSIAQDPTDESVIYSAQKKFSMDYTKSPGKGWDYEAFTLNYHKYPDDPRAHSSAAFDFCAGKVQYIQGQKLLFMMDRDMVSMAVFRFDKETDGEIAIPAMAIIGVKEENGEKYPPHHPGGYALWTDKNGDGGMDEGEYENASSLALNGRDFFVDDKGNIMRALEGGTVYTIPFKGFNRYGVPEWDVTQMDQFALEEEEYKTRGIRRVWYDMETDEMYITLKNEGDNIIWRSIGTTLLKYTDWSNKSARKLAFEVKLPLGDILPYTGQPDNPQGISVAGDYIFFGYMTSPQTYILRRDTGELYDMIPFPFEVGKWWAAVDVCTSYRANLLSDGTYAIFIEDDSKIKQWVLLWRDKGGPQNFNENKTLGVALDNRQLVFADQEPLNIDGRTMVPMRYIFETLGATVTWDAATRTVTGSVAAGTTRLLITGENNAKIVYPESHTVRLTIDDKTALVDGKSVELDVPAQIVNDRTMVPLRVVAEGLGVQVDWYGEENLVNIVTDKYLTKYYKETEVVK